MGPGPPPWGDDTVYHPSHLDPDLTHHIEHCTCPCNHLGYGRGAYQHQQPQPAQHVSQPTTPGPSPRTPRTTRAAAVAAAMQASPHKPPATVGYYPDYERIRTTQIPPSPVRVNASRPSPVRYWQAAAAPPRPVAFTHFGQQPRRYFSHHDDSFSIASSEDEVNFRRRPWCLCLFLCFLLAALSAALVVPMVLNKSQADQTNATSTALNGPTATNTTVKQRLQVIKRLLKESPLIDAHNDLPWNIRKFIHNRLKGIDFSSNLKNVDPWKNSPWSQTDIPRMRAGLIGAQFWSAYVPCESQYLDAVQLTLEQIDVIKRLVRLYKKDLQLAFTAREILEVHRSGRIASLIGIEGGHSLGNSLGVLRSLYDLGARYMTLTHTCDTPWAESSSLHEGGFIPINPTDPSAIDPGLSQFGLTIIREMNRLGMMVDLSHTSVATVRAALNFTKAPVIFSHSSAYAVCNSTRNVPDDLLKLLAKNRGIIMVNFYSNLVNCNGTSATLKDVIRHINHIRSVAGMDYVGLGAGYDGINSTPDGLSDVSKYPQLLADLLAEPGWTEKDVLKLAGLNLLRVFEEVEKVREGWKLAAIQPAEDIPPPLPVDAPKCQYEHS